MDRQRHRTSSSPTNYTITPKLFDRTSRSRVAIGGPTGAFIVILYGIFGGVLAELIYHQDLAGFWATFFTNASVTDLWGSVVKTTLFGAIIAIVCCYKGMTASGGAAGVGRAVNEAVVIAFSGIWAFNYVFTQTLLATHPDDVFELHPAKRLRPPSGDA